MPVYKAEAIVLRQQALGEADRIVTLFTREYGKLRAAAKGIRRPASRLGGRLEPFTHARLLLARGRTLDVIAQAEIVEAFAGVRADLIRSAYAAYVAELVDRGLADRDPHQEVFTLTLDVLETLGTRERKVTDQKGRKYSLRVRPYRTTDDKIDGAVLTLIDVDGEANRRQKKPEAGSRTKK